MGGYVPSVSTFTGIITLSVQYGIIERIQISRIRGLAYKMIQPGKVGHNFSGVGSTIYQNPDAVTRSDKNGKWRRSKITRT